MGVSTRRRLFALLVGYCMTPVHEGVRPVGAAIGRASSRLRAAIAVPGTGRVETWSVSVVKAMDGSRSVSEGVVGIPDATGAPEVMEQAGQLASDGDASASLVALGPTSSDAFAVAPEVAVATERTKDVRGCIHEQASEQSIAALGDAQLRRLGARVMKFRSQPDVVANGSRGPRSVPGSSIVAA